MKKSKKKNLKQRLKKLVFLSFVPPSFLFHFLLILMFYFILFYFYFILFCFIFYFYVLQNIMFFSFFLSFYFIINIHSSFQKIIFYNLINNSIYHNLSRFNYFIFCLNQSGNKETEEKSNQLFSAKRFSSGISNIQKPHLSITLKGGKRKRGRREDSKST